MASNSIGTISLSDLVALNDEMAALVRAGIPLEQGLVEFGAEAPGNLGAIASQIGERLRMGQTLTQVLHDESQTLPPVWTAMVAAGIRSGRLGSVLESLAVTGRRVAETRKTVIGSLIYPCIVLVLAYLVFVFLVLYLAPLLISASLELTGTLPAGLRPLEWLGSNAFWLVVPPVLLVLLMFIEWQGTRRGFVSSDGPLSRLVSWLWPPIRTARRDARWATFTEILSLLIREETPLPEALALSGNACGDRHIQATAVDLSRRLDQGESAASQETRIADLPPILAFMLSSGLPRAQLSDALNDTAQHYRERSLDVAAQAAVYLPIFLTAVIGGGVTLAVGTVTLLPVWRLILQLGSPS